MSDTSPPRPADESASERDASTEAEGEEARREKDPSRDHNDGGLESLLAQIAEIATYKNEPLQVPEGGPCLDDLMFRLPERRSVPTRPPDDATTRPRDDAPKCVTGRDEPRAAFSPTCSLQFLSPESFQPIGETSPRNESTCMEFLESPFLCTSPLPPVSPIGAASFSPCPTFDRPSLDRPIPQPSSRSLIVLSQPLAVSAHRASPTASLSSRGGTCLSRSAPTHRGLDGSRAADTSAPSGRGRARGRGRTRGRGKGRGDCSTTNDLGSSDVGDRWGSTKSSDGRRAINTEDASGRRQSRDILKSAGSHPVHRTQSLSNHPQDNVGKQHARKTSEQTVDQWMSDLLSTSPAARRSSDPHAHAVRVPWDDSIFYFQPAAESSVPSGPAAADPWRSAEDLVADDPVTWCDECAVGCLRDDTNESECQCPCHGTLDAIIAAVNTAAVDGASEHAPYPAGTSYGVPRFSL